MFGAVFPNHSYPMDASSFTQIDQTHWLLDLADPNLRHVCLFLLSPSSLPPDKALSLYFQPPSADAAAPAAFSFCGAVSSARPSAVLPLPWPADSVCGTAKIGVSVEDLAAVPSMDAAAERRVERMAMKVGENLFNFMQSFCGLDGSRLVVPMDILDRWFKKFQERAKRDPQYLKSFDL